MARLYLRQALLLPTCLALLLAGCGVRGPTDATAPTPPAASAAPAASVGPGGGSDIVPTIPTVPLSEADRAATATAAAIATPTPYTQAESETATALAAGGPPDRTVTPTPYTQAESETATAALALTAGPRPAPVTRTPWADARPVLPEPIYLLAAEPAQVVRVERDLDYRLITFEPQPVLELAVPAAAGAIFYLVGEPDGAERTLFALSGAGRRELLAGALSSLAVSPDGQQLYFRLDDPEPGLIIGQDGSPAGVWSLAADGGRPSLVIADAPADGVYDEAAPAWAYSPIAVSPDGARVALYAVDLDGPAVPGGELVLVGGDGEPARGPTCCETPAWSVDSTVLHTGGGGPGPDVRYGLFVHDAASGDERAVIAASPDGSIPLVLGPRQLADGQLYAFVELAPAEDFTWDYPFRPALARVAPDGTLAPLAPPVAAPREVLWAPNGSGAVLAALAEQYGRPNQLFWQPADGQPATLIPFVGGAMAWVPANASLADGVCAAFTPIMFQEPAARQFSAAAFDVQARLWQLGFDAGQPDGLYGEQTRSGVAAFQQARGLPATGDVDCATWQALLAQP